MLYQRIAEYIMENDLKQGSVARKAGMTKQAFSDSMRGNRRLTADEYSKICKALNVSLDLFSEYNCEVKH